MENQTTLLEFPCTYFVKVIGRNTEEFQTTVRSIMENNIHEHDEATYSSRLSSGNTYLSITVTFVARNHGQLNSIYSELNAADLVLVAL